MTKNNKAITLIALVITILVLVILGGVTIALSFGKNGIIARAKQASESSKYRTAKEAIMIKLNDIKLKCREDGKDCTIIDIMLGFEDENVNDILVDNYLYEDEAAIRKGSEQYKNSSKIANNKLKAVVVSHQSAEEYKFCIDGDGEIQGITKDKNIDNLTSTNSFEPIIDFEVDNGFDSSLHVWNRYNVIKTPKKNVSVDRNVLINIPYTRSTMNATVYSQYSFNDNGFASYSGAIEKNTAQLKGYYWGNVAVVYAIKGQNSGASNGLVSYMSDRYTCSISYTYSKDEQGDIERVYSANPDEYPKNDRVGEEYWYVFVE